MRSGKAVRTPPQPEHLVPVGGEQQPEGGPDVAAPGDEHASHASAASSAVSDDLGVLQPRDVVPRVAEQLGQDLLGVLAELGRGQADLSRASR